MSDPDALTPVERPQRCACCDAWAARAHELGNAIMVTHARLARLLRGHGRLDEVQAAVDRLLAIARDRPPVCSR